jgi:hypothetical protein
MNNYFHKLARYTALVLISSAPFPIETFADDLEKKQLAPVTSTLHKMASTRNFLREKQQQVTYEATEALAATQSALYALEKKESLKALIILQAMSEKLAALAAKNTPLTLVPAEVNTTIADFNGDIDTVKKTIHSADGLLGSGKIQAARQLLAELVSEIRVSSTNISLNVFSEAFKNAALFIKAGKFDTATNTLNDALNSVITITEIIPLPLLGAEQLLAHAAELSHKADLSNEQNRQRLLNAVEAAKDKLGVALLLGYGSEDDYKNLFAAIDEVKATAFSEASTTNWGKLALAFSDLKNKLITVS